MRMTMDDDPLFNLASRFVDQCLAINRMRSRRRSQARNECHASLLQIAGMSVEVFLQGLENATAPVPVST